MATIVFGTIGVLASQGLGRLAGCSVLVSSGTLLAVVGMAGLGGGSAMVAAALYYLVSSTLGDQRALPDGRAGRARAGRGRRLLAVTAEAYGSATRARRGRAGASGSPCPARITVLGLCFAAARCCSPGLPPLSGFVAKFAMLSAAARTRAASAAARRRASRSPSPRSHPVGPRRADRAGAGGHPDLLGSDRGGAAAVLLIEIAPVVAAAGADRGADGEGRAGDALHGRDRPRAAPSARLYPRACCGAARPAGAGGAPNEPRSCPIRC